MSQSIYLCFWEIEYILCVFLMLWIIFIVRLVLTFSRRKSCAYERDISVFYLPPQPSTVPKQTIPWREFQINNFYFFSLMGFLKYNVSGSLDELFVTKPKAVKLFRHKTYVNVLPTDVKLYFKYVCSRSARHSLNGANKLI